MESLQPKKKHGCLISVIAVFVFIAIIGGVVSTLNQKGKATSAESSSTSTAPESTAPESVPTKIGVPVDNGKISIKINTVKEAKSITDDNGLIYNPDDGGKFIVVNLTAKNTGKELYSFLVNNFQLKSSDGKQYTPDSLITAGKEYLNSCSINPGLSETGYIAFEVPKAVKPSSLVLEFQKFWSLDTAEFSLSSK